uniref:Bromo domain-containing protein n=1 Tax=Strongyloides papillosus TaxID=174720 RepID=A0A0N5CIM1_STREA
MDTIKTKIRGFEPWSDVKPSDSQTINKHLKMLKMMTLNVRSLFHKLFELNELWKTDIILDGMEKARKPFDAYMEKDWKRPVDRPPKRLLSLVPDNSTLRKQPDRKAKSSLNVNIYKCL